MPILTLDGALDAIGLRESHVLILKIDVEGYEPAVIAGAARTLARTDVVVSEWSPSLSRSGGLSIVEMLNQLTDFGFMPHMLSSEGKINPVGPSELVDVDDQVDVIWIKANR